MSRDYTALSALRTPSIEAFNADLADASATEIIEWAYGRYGNRLCLTSSMQDAVLIDLAVRVNPAVEVVFIDTGYHFPETLQMVDDVRRHYGLNLRMMTVKRHAPELWLADPENCCSAVKVGQLDRALAEKEAWLSGLRRADSAERANAPIVSRDVRGLVKINPICAWSDAEVADYIDQHDVPVNPLLAQGYGSVGCMPCTKPVASGAHARSGRWQGSTKTECGLHL